MPKGHGRSSKSVVTSVRITNDMNNVINYLCDEYDHLHKNTMINDALRMYGNYHKLLLHPIIGPMLRNEWNIKEFNEKHEKFCSDISVLADL